MILLQLRKLLRVRLTMSNEELFLKNGQLVSEAVWRRRLDLLRAKVASLPDVPVDTLIEELEAALIAAMKKRLPASGERVGIFFSGGVDSTFIAFLCQELGALFTCYTAGYHDAELAVPADILAAREIASELTFDHVEKIYDTYAAKELFAALVALFGHPANNTADVDAQYLVTLGVAAVVYAAHGARQHNEHIFFSGLGSEEIFAGYERHAKVLADGGDVDAECWQGLYGMWQRDLLRDAKLATELGFTVATPLLDEDVIVAAMRLPASVKISTEYKKIILRQIAEKMGMPQQFAWRKKKAAQYGSKFDRALSVLAKEHGFQFKREYVASVIEQVLVAK